MARDTEYIVVIESITKLVSAENKMEIKCWRQELTSNYDQQTNREDIQKVLAMHKGTLQQLGDSLIEIPRMNAVEIMSLVTGAGAHFIKEYQDE